MTVEGSFGFSPGLQLVQLLAGELGPDSCRGGALRHPRLCPLDLDPEGFTFLLGDALFVLLDGDIRRLSRVNSWPVPRNWPRPAGRADPLVGELVPERRRVELADDIALLHPRPFGQDPDDGRPALDLAMHVRHLGRLDDPAFGDHDPELAGPDLDGRGVVGPDDDGTRRRRSTTRPGPAGRRRRWSRRRRRAGPRLPSDIGGTSWIEGLPGRGWRRNPGRSPGSRGSGPRRRP